MFPIISETTRVLNLESIIAQSPLNSQHITREGYMHHIQTHKYQETPEVLLENSDRFHDKTTSQLRSSWGLNRCWSQKPFFSLPFTPPSRCCRSIISEDSDFMENALIPVSLSFLDSPRVER